MMMMRVHGCVMMATLLMMQGGCMMMAIMMNGHMVSEVCVEDDE